MSSGILTLDKNQFLSFAKKMTKSKLLINHCLTKGNSIKNQMKNSNLIYSNILPNKERSRSLNAMMANILKQEPNSNEISREYEKEKKQIKHLICAYEDNVKIYNSNHKKDENSNFSISKDSFQSKLFLKSNRHLHQNNDLSDSFSNNDSIQSKNMSYLNTHLGKKKDNSMNFESKLINKTMPSSMTYNANRSLSMSSTNNNNNYNMINKNIINNLEDNKIDQNIQFDLEKSNDENKESIQNHVPTISNLSSYSSMSINDNVNIKNKKQKNSFLRSITYLNNIKNNNTNFIKCISKDKYDENSKYESTNNSPNTSKVYNSNHSFGLKSRIYNNTNFIEKEKEDEDDKIHINKSHTVTEKNISIRKNLNDNKIKEKTSTIIQLEDLIVLEEKIFNIVNSFEIESPHPSLCIEWWNFYSYTSFCGKFENFFNKEKNNYEFQIAHETIILELLSIILIYEILRDSSITHSIFNLLKNLINEIYQNYLIVCNYILSSINIKTNTNIWINKLLNIISSKLKKKIKNKNENISQLKIGNNNIYSLISNILKQNQNSRNKINTVSLNNYFKKINSISINTLNEYFIKKINIDYSKTGDSLSYIINDSISDQKKITIPYLDKKLSNGKDFTLVLDLDDTLINYKLDEKGRGILRPRPNLYNFLNEMRQIFEMILFTAGTSEYADPILNIIDKKKIFFDKILYRQHTIIMDNVFVKDLSKLGRDLSKVIIIDNMPQSFKLQKENGIFIKSFNGDNKKDSTLFDLIPILKKIAGNSNNDVRVELNKMKNEIFTKITTNLQNED